MLKTLLILTLFMFTFNNKVLAEYEKIFFDLNIKNIDGKIINFSEYNDKAILLVNVASKCGFTKQYNNLQTLWETYKDKGLIVLGVPSNQFGGQEPGTNKEIKSFCEINFNITFPLTEKVDVKGDKANAIYKWAYKNHGKSTVPKWNFHKILINREGKIEDTFSSFTEPTSKKIVNKIEKILKKS
jgi:glutathione peroxidase